MKKVSLVLSIALMVVILFSCSKKDENVVVPKQYASFVSGQFIPNDGDITLKSAPLTPTVGGHQINCYDKKVESPSVWTVIDGSEFLPGSAPALPVSQNGWHGYAIDDAAWWFSGNVYITYCPVLPMRVVLKATTGGYGTPVSYLGIWEGTPNVALFPITVQDRRLGDALTLNTDALTALPGYTNLSFSVSYDKGMIDLPNTIATSPVTTSAWPVYVYSSTVNVIDQVISGAGEQTVYEGLDAKILGTITIKIHVDNTTILKTVAAPVMGHGMRITLKTTKVGWYDSGTIGVTENDITADLVDINI